MAIHKLVVDDFEDLNYSLLAVHCEMEDYRLAYFLNQNLETRLAKSPLNCATTNIHYYLSPDQCVMDKVLVYKIYFLNSGCF